MSKFGDLGRKCGLVEEIEDVGVVFDDAGAEMAGFFGG